jgi:hypothetical protein
MISEFDVMRNGPVLDLLLSRQAKVISLNHTRITCCNHQSWRNRLPDCHRIPQGTALDSGQRGEVNIMGADVIDQTIRAAFDE